MSYSVVFDTCADTPATNWTAKAGSDGSYMLYNESADQCLHVGINQLSMADWLQRPELAHGYQQHRREPGQQPVS
ncbi:hypothetical protein GCM10009647_026470 [Streptomyces sanglieri]|uniref:Uncharacterized protein n=1 Tax=Streptomyces sanglieri TaxID=193460 RepID=A0ABW2WQJ5_9ACTN